MMLYIGKLIACSGLLYLIYWLVLRNQKLLVFNRFYLLGIIPLSVIIPLIKIVVPFDLLNLLNDRNSDTIPIGPTITQPATDSALFNNYHVDWYNISLLVYVIVTIALLLKQVWLYHKFLYYIRSATPSHEQSIYCIHGLKTPFSFFQKIYVPKDAYQQDGIDQSIITHERAHANQRHSMDVLFIQILGIFLWFNPFIYFIQKSIRQTHEYLADDAVVKIHEKLRYQHLIIEWSMSTPDINTLPASNFNFLTTKKRLIMLQKRTTRSKLLLMPGLTLLLTVAISTLFSTQVEAQKTTPTTTKKAATANTAITPPESKQPDAPKTSGRSPKSSTKEMVPPMISQRRSSSQQEGNVRFPEPRKRPAPPQKSPKIIEEVIVEEVKFPEPQKKSTPSKKTSAIIEKVQVVPKIEEVRVEDIQLRQQKRINLSANANVSSNQDQKDIQVKEETPPKIVLKMKPEVEVKSVNKK
ncbi:M56 family metallopeptidase [Sphingobacterium sp. WOUb80]|uniref:M56 family metallopeptidase n=1 Tax=Sphingobacterium sp. WOUb80 TaxID=3234028 RepID=UPI003CEF0AA5